MFRCYCRAALCFSMQRVEGCVVVKREQKLCLFMVKLEFL